MESPLRLRPIPEGPDPPPVLQRFWAEAWPNGASVLSVPAATRRPRRPTSAAFFDLDRTLLAGASGPAFSRAFRAAGLLPESVNPLEGPLFKFFDVFGENYPSMLISRQAARLAKGRHRSETRAAAAEAAEELAESIQPYARVEAAEHRAAGRAIVIATTTPFDWVEPLAERLGFDDVIATRFNVDGDVYDGTIDGEFVWGKAKARAVTDWAEERSIDLSESYAYSDSYYDVPLLSVVGHPCAVNPDPRLVAIAAFRRWPQRFLDVPPGVPKVGGIEPQRALMPFVRAELMPYVRFKLYGLGRIPDSGPAILVANHRSYFDPIAVGYTLAKRGRAVRFLGKKEVFDAPVVGDVARAMGGIRVERGTGADEPLRAAEEALAAGELVAMMPQGTIPRGRAFFDPVLRGRWGAAKLAQASGAPVIPIGLWGTEEIWPRSARLPNLTRVFDPAPVSIRVGRPVDLGRSDLQEDTDAIMAAISAQLPAEAREPYEPSPEEIARMLPPGVDDVDAGHETARRPGQD